MDVRFEIKLGETTNKNFLVFISTELTKKLKFELQGTDKLNWSFKKADSILDISDGYIKKESYQEKDRYGNRGRMVEEETLIKGVLVINFKNVDSMNTVNAVFDIVNKYANLIIYEGDEDNKDNELIEMIEEVALDEE